MRNKYLLNFIKSAIICAALCCCLITDAEAQDQFRVSVQAGLQVLNNDVVTAANNEGNQAWVFGLGVSTKSTVGNVPVEYSLRFSHGQTELLRQQSMFNGFTQSTNLRYQSLTFEAMRVFGLSELFEFSLGLNFVPQYRTLLYDFENISPERDRLLSFGMGLSGKLSLIEAYSKNRSAGLVFGIAAQWTEFFIHNSRNRPIDGFRYRHFIVSPHLGIRF